MKTMVVWRNLRWDISNTLITAIGLRRYGRALLLAEDIATGITLEYGKLLFWTQWDRRNFTLNILSSNQF
jgi:hypothetical protein